MNLIKIENNYSWFLSDDKKAKEVLWKSLRFRERGYYHNAAYRMKKWDGYTEFFKMQSGRFLTGLLPEIKMALKHLKVDYEVEDKRQPFIFDCDFVDENWMNYGKYAVVLRDYQIDYINQAIKNKRGIIPSPTSSGKSNMMIGILKALPPRTPTLVLANRIDLVEQNYDEISKFGIKNVGRYYGKKKEPNIITCATVQSAMRLEKLLPSIKVMVVDEIHEMMSKKPRAVYNKLNNAVVRIGMSATAFKFGGSDKSQKYEVKGWIGPLFVSHHTEDGKITTKELQERGILSKATCNFFKITEPKLPYDIYLDAVTRGIAENNHFHDLVAKLVSKLTGRTLIIVERIEHGDRLHERIPGALWVKGKDTIETRKEIVNRLKTDKGNLVAIATTIFNTGVNFFVHNLLNTSGGQADHQIIQRFGRGLRVATDKEQLMYYDFLFEINDYLEKHSYKRIKILEKEGHTVTVHPTEMIEKWGD